MKALCLLMNKVKLLLVFGLVFTFCMAAPHAHGSWFSGGPYGGDINCLTMAKTNPDVMYAGTDYGVFKTADGGNTWTKTGFPEIPVRAIQVAPEGRCQLQTINFDDVTAPCNFSETVALTNEYSALGVLFSGPGGNDGGAILNECSSSFPDAQSSPNFLAFDIRETLNNGGIAQGSETLTFTPPTSYAKINAAWQGGTTMEAYDASDNLIDSDTVIPGGAFRPIRVSGTGITKVVISFIDNTLLLDDLAFTRQLAGPQPDVVYAGTDDGIYKSEDGGETWDLQGPLGEKVNAIAVDPANPCILFAGTESPSVQYGGKVFKSSDGGETWDEKLSGPLTRVAALLISTDNTEHIYAGVSDLYGFWKSEDRGETWIGRKVGSRDPNTVSALSMTGAGFSPSAIYAVASDDVYMSTDQGESWTPTNIASPYTTSTLAVDPNNSSVIYVGSRGPAGILLKSSDAGDTWLAKVNGLPAGRLTRSAPSSIVIDPRNSDVYLGLFEGGVYKSTDEAASWNISSKGLYDISSIEGLAAHPSLSDTVYAAIEGSGYNLAITTNGGTSWNYLGGSPTNLGAVAIDLLEPFTIWVGDGWRYQAAPFIYKSTNGGQSWTEIWIFTSLGWDYKGVSDIWVRPSDSSTILVAVAGYPTEGGGLYKSTDGGVTWQNRRMLWVNTLTGDPTDSNTIYLGTERPGYVIQSTDCGGNNWETISPGDQWVWEVRDIEVDLDSHVYAATDEGLMKWDGSDWTKLTGLPTDDISALAIDISTNPVIVYAGTGGEGVFVSSDGGDTWIPFNVGLGSLSVTKLAVSSSQPKMLYAGTAYGAVWSRKIMAAGDVNGDANVALDDAVLALQVCAGLTQTSTVELGADANGDGNIGLAEAIYIIQKVAGVRQ